MRIRPGDVLRILRYAATAWGILGPIIKDIYRTIKNRNKKGGEKVASLPGYEDVKCQITEFIGAYEAAKAEESLGGRKVTIIEGAMLVGTLAREVATIGTNLSDASNDEIAVWTGDVLLALYRDPDVLNDPDIPLIFDPIESQLEAVGIKAAGRTIARAVLNKIRPEGEGE